MKIIKSKNTDIIVDSDMYDELNKHKWQISTSGYARRTVVIDKKHKTLYMHRLLLNCKFGEEQVDHINGNKLDNRISNLRIIDGSNNVKRGKKKIQGYVIQKQTNHIYCTYYKNDIRFSFGRVKDIKEANYVHDLFVSVFFDELSYFIVKRHNKEFAINKLISITKKRQSNKNNNSIIQKNVEGQLKCLIHYKNNNVLINWKE